MGVTAASLPGTRGRPRRRITHVRARPTRRAAEARIVTGGDRPSIEPWLFCGKSLTPCVAPSGPKTLWEKLQDDRELVGVKIALLATLLIMTAALELVA
ncbi:MAG TPA: hypothetical protein VKV57_15340 [bacterium]|nr:hypothetical protein [bacterium]